MEPRQPAFTIPANSVGLLAQFQKIPIEVGQHVLGLHIFRNFTEEKINMEPVNMSKSESTICVIVRMLRQNDSILLQLFIP